MKQIWLKVEKMELSVSKKNKLFLALTVIAAALAGGVAWLLVGQWVLPGALWILAFVEYPAVFVGLFGGIWYLWNNQFS